MNARILYSLRIAVIAFMTLLPRCPLAVASQAVAEEAVSRKDIEYATVDGISLKLDLFLPAERTNVPLVICVHDGATFVPRFIDDESGVGVQTTGADVIGDGRPDILTVSRLGTFLFLNQNR